MKKAYRVYDANGWESGSVIAFAETAGKAKVIAMSDDNFEDTPYQDLRARRDKYYDKYAKNRIMLDWYNPTDRRILVKSGWSCYEPEKWECEGCECNDICDKAKEWEDIKNGKF